MEIFSTQHETQQRGVRRASNRLGSCEWRHRGERATSRQDRSKERTSSHSSQELVVIKQAFHIQHHCVHLLRCPWILPAEVFPNTRIPCVRSSATPRIQRRRVSDVAARPHDEDHDLRIQKGARGGGLRRTPTGSDQSHEDSGKRGAPLPYPHSSGPLR